jgi:DNA-binding transcriptional ArsR family regulator
MRFDIPQEVPGRREIAPDAPSTTERNVPKEQESHPILRRLKALSERASEHRPNHEPPRRTKSAPQHKEQETPARREVKDPRGTPDTRRTQRNHIPTQTIGMQLRPEERKTMLELGRFRIIRTDDLADAVYNGRQRKLSEDLSYLRSKGLVTTRHINLRRDGKRRYIDRIEVATLTTDGRAWLRKSGEVSSGQTVYAGFVKPREMEHDSLIYRAYRKEAEQITDQGGTNLRVKLDFEIKADVQKAIYAERKADPKRDMAEIKEQVAKQQELPFVDGRIQIPDARIEFDSKLNDDQDQGSRTGHEDIEVLTAAYRPGHLRAKAQAGFRAYAAGADRASITAKIEDDHNMMRDVLDL